MSLEEMKLELIKEISDIKTSDLIITLYEIIVNLDFDYIPDLFYNKEDFEDFIEKGTPKKEEDNEGNN